jgi:uncharacterized membrane-anchored protein
MTVLAMASCAAAYADGQPLSGEKSAGQAWLERQDSATRAMLEMYGATEEYLAMQAQMDDIVAQQERTEQKRKTQNLLIIALSLIIALIPTVAVIRMAVQGKFRNPTAGGILRAVLILLAGGVVLFALNYGWFYLRANYGQEMNKVLAGLIVVGLVVLAIVMMRKDKPEKKDSGSSPE